MRAQFVLQEIWTGLRRNLTMTIALIVVVAISLSLLGTGLLFVKQVDNTRTYWQGKVELSIYLCTKTSVQPAVPAERAGHRRRAGPARSSDLKSMPQVRAGLLRVPGAGLPAVQAGLLATSPSVQDTWSARRHPGLVPGEAEATPRPTTTSWPSAVQRHARGRDRRRRR